MRELAQLAVLGNKCSGKSDVSCAMMSMPAESTGLLGINFNNIKYPGKNDVHYIIIHSK